MRSGPVVPRADTRKPERVPSRLYWRGAVGNTRTRLNNARDRAVPTIGGFHLGEIEQIHGCHASYFTTSTFLMHSLFHPNPNRMDAG